MKSGQNSAAPSIQSGKDDYTAYEESDNKRRSPILEYIILTTTESTEDVNTVQPLHKRIFKLTSLARCNIALIISQSFKKGITPLITQYYVELLQVAYLAQLSGAGSSAAIAAISSFYWAIAFACICFLAFRVYDCYADIILKEAQLKPKILATKETLSQSTPDKNIRKNAVYNEARSSDNSKGDLSELGARFSNLTRKTISFFIDIAIFSMLIGPYMLIVGLIAMVITAGISSWITQFDRPRRQELSKKASEANNIEHQSLYGLSPDAIAASKLLAPIALELSMIKTFTDRIKKLSGDWAHPLAYLFFSISVLSFNMEPLTAMILANTFQKSFNGLLDYPEVVLGRQKFETALGTQVRAIDDQDPSFIQKHYDELNKPYFSLESIEGFVARICIYTLILTIIPGILLIPTPAITPIIVSFISQYSYQQIGLSMASGWLFSSAFFGIINGLDYEAENTSSYYLIQGLLILSIAASIFYTPILLNTYAQTAWTAYMYLGMVSIILSTTIFDAYCFQYFAFAIDAISIYISQEITTILQAPQFAYKITRDTTCNTAKQSYSFVCSTSFNSVKYLFHGVQSLVKKGECFFGEQANFETP